MPQNYQKDENTSNHSGRNIGAGKTTLLQKLKQSVSMADNFKIKTDNEPVGAFQTFYGNDMMHPLQTFYQNPKENVFIFQNYVYLPAENGSFVCCGTNVQGYCDRQRF